MKFSSLILGLFFISQCFSQNDQSSTLIGATIGPTYNFLWGANGLGEWMDPSFGFNAGAFVRQEVRPGRSIQCGPSFVRHTTESQIFFTDIYGMQIGNAKIRNDFNFIHLPATFRWEFGDYPAFFTEAGFFMAFLVSEEFKVIGAHTRSETPARE